MKHTTTVLSVFDLAPRRIGGLETMARELSLQLGERGWRSVLCFRSPPTDSVKQFLQLPNVQFEVIPDMSRWSWACQRKLMHLIGQYCPAIMHLSFVDLFAPYAGVARMRGVARVFFTDQISRPEDYSPQRSRFFKQAAYRMAIPVTKVFCVSDFVRQCWIDTGRLPADRFATVYNGVDVERCDRSLDLRDQFRARHSLPAEAVLVTQIGSLIHEKGCATLLHAAKRVVDASPQVVFVFAGDGKQREEYQLLASRLGLGDRVRFLGLVNDPVGEGLFAASDIICQASNWQEAFGLSIAEAMACGRPVVATRVGGIPELVQDGKTGCLVDRGDSEALAGVILKLAASAGLRHTYGNQGRQFCRTHFDHRANAAKMIDLYGLPDLSAAPADRPGRAAAIASHPPSTHTPAHSCS